VQTADATTQTSRPTASAEATVRRVPVPPAVRELSSLARVDYADTFLVDVGAVRSRTAQEWALHIFDGMPVSTRAALLVGWWTLGMGLRPWRHDDAVLGWAIRRSDSDHVILGARSPLGLSAELLVKREGTVLLFATFVHKRNASGQALWAGVEPGHRPVVHAVMSSASRRARDENRGRRT
jgi:hypothetical protein